MAKSIFQIKAKIIKNIEVAPEYFKASFIAPEIAKSAKPGQFVEIKVSNDPAPFLRRPLGVHRVYASNIEILYEKLGRGTEILSQKRAGEYLDVIGPLGKGFNYGTQVTSHKSQVLIAGGMGVAPLVFLAEKLVHSSQFTVHRKPLVLIGAKTKSSLLCEKEFKALGCDVQVATEDGSKGFKGRVTELLKDILRGTKDEGRGTIIYACGPRPMLEEVALISEKYDIPAQVSLEAHMACGIGACLGCVINTQDGYKRVCKEGPVFKASEVIWP